MQSLEPQPVGVLGGGSFGTALASVLAEVGHQVDLWVHNPERAREMAQTRINSRYHPDFELSERIHPSHDLQHVTQDKRLVIAVSPSHVTRAVLSEAAPMLHPEAIVACATKGLEIETRMMMSEVFEEVLPAPNRPLAAYLSGPSFAREMMTHLPTAIAVAAHRPEVAKQVQRAFTGPRFRVYTVDDVIGVEVAGAVKNVMAIAAGISDGLNFGHNSRAALITRGLAEIARLGIKLGAKERTFMGLAGMGDLLLTCTGDLSRNRNVGLKLGRGATLKEILAEATQVAEGVNTTKAVYHLSRKEGVSMPIVEAVYHILYQGKAPGVAVSELMARPLKSETE